MSHRPAKIRPPLCEYPVGLRPPGYSQSGISNTLHMYSINVLIYANDNKFNCKKLFVKNRKILIDIHKIMAMHQLYTNFIGISRVLPAVLSFSRVFYTFFCFSLCKCYFVCFSGVIFY